MPQRICAPVTLQQWVEVSVGGRICHYHPLTSAMKDGKSMGRAFVWAGQCCSGLHTVWKKGKRRKTIVGTAEADERGSTCGKVNKTITVQAPYVELSLCAYNLDMNAVCLIKALHFSWFLVMNQLYKGVLFLPATQHMDTKNRAIRQAHTSPLHVDPTWFLKVWKGLLSVADGEKPADIIKNTSEKGKIYFYRHYLMLKALMQLALFFCKS